MEPMRDMPSDASSNILNIMTEMASVQLKIVQASLHKCIFDLENHGDPVDTSCIDNIPSRC